MLRASRLRRSQLGACGCLGCVCEESSRPRRCAAIYRCGSAAAAFAGDGDGLWALIGQLPSLRAPGFALGALQSSGSAWEVGDGVTRPRVPGAEGGQPG